MIKSITIEECFETSNHWFLGSERIGGGRTGGYKLSALPVGTVLRTNRPLVVLIGPNGSGKSTLLEKLAAQTSELGKKYSAHYFNLRYQGNKPSVYLVGRTSQQEQEDLSDRMGKDVIAQSFKILEEEKKEVNVLLPCHEALALAENIEETVFKETKDQIQYIQKASTGQFQEFHLFQEIGQAKAMPAGTVLGLDEPTLGLDMVNTRKMIQAIRDYASGPGRQVFVATHDLAFCKLPSAKIISLYDKTATSYDSESLHIEKYLEALT